MYNAKPGVDSTVLYNSNVLRDRSLNVLTEKIKSKQVTAGGVRRVN